MKAIIIIGGSRGIGRATIEALLPNYKLINISRNAPDIEHANLTHYNCDVISDDLPNIENADGLIYCPGSINLKPFKRLSLEDFRNDFEINVIGAIKSIQAYSPALIKSESGSIVLFSTVATAMGMPFHASIAVAKAGVEALVKSLGAELAPHIRFNAIAPTITDTGLAVKLLRNDLMKEKMQDRHPMKTYLQPDDVADMAEFLISEKSKKISGQIIELDCGIVTFKL